MSYPGYIKSKFDLKTALIGSYIPRRCGIATFTSDLCNSIIPQLSRDGDSYVIAIDDTPGGYDYPTEVRLEIHADMVTDYRMAAEYLNISPVDVVILQHEFGIFGGEGGCYINTLLERLRKPVIATLHTVLENPRPEYRSVMDKLIRFCDRLVVMSHRSRQMLRAIYDVPDTQIALIPHGIPDLAFVDPNFHKDELDLAGRRMILTFGLVSPDKGLELMIKAMPAIVQKYPDAVYMILGATHPHIKRRHGEHYRSTLKQLARELAVADNVVFINRFAERDQLVQYLGAADVYVTPYLNREQVVSGTLAYAIGAGKAVVSTPYRYAEELLAEERGRLVNFGDVEGLAREILWLFDHEVDRHAIRKRAYMYARGMVWEQVGRSYINLANDVCAYRRGHRRPAFRRPPREYNHRPTELPEINLQHLNVLTDRVGILQHAKFATPDRRHGYCTDDNARALALTAMHWSLYEDSEIIPLIHRYLSFLDHAYNPGVGKFRNFLTFDLQWTEQVGSEDSHARALWGLGALIADAPNHSLLALANAIFHQALPAAVDFEFSRSTAMALVGIHHYLSRFSVDTRVCRVRETLASRLMDRYRQCADDGWVWCENTLTYSNALIPQALLLAGQCLPDNDIVRMSLRSLQWLLDVQTGEDDQLSLVGNDGWYTRGGRKARFDQQPVDAMCLVGACIEAYNVTTEPRWLRQGQRCFEWFMGRNDLNMPLYDFRTGGCRDGLAATSVNQNQGAESTLAWLISLAAMHLIFRQTRDVEEKASGPVITPVAPANPANNSITTQNQPT